MPVLGVGSGAHWIYFPDADSLLSPVPHAMSDGVCPPGTSSLYVEFGWKRDESADLIAREKAALERCPRGGTCARGSRIARLIRIDPAT
jgi:hypothetical protein